MSAFHTRWNAFFSGRRSNAVLRFSVFFVGVYIIALSIALARTAGLGTSPIASIPNVMSYLFPAFTIGTYQFMLNALMVLGQIALNKSFKKPVELFQMIAVFFFSAFVDLNVYALQGLPVDSYALAWLWTAISIFLLAFGVVLELFADTVIMPGEGIILSISRVWGKEFAKCKIGFDSANVIIAAVISLIAFSAFVGVREGTVANALFTGIFVGLLKKPMGWLLAWIPDKPTAIIPAETAAGASSDTYPPLVITVSRTYGSGGREIGRIVADRLGIACYDETMIELVAQRTGLTADYVAAHEEEVRKSLLYLQEYQFINANPSQEDELFLAQTNVITSLCKDDSCVFVGRMSDFILTPRANVLRVFVNAPLDRRIKRVMQREGLSTDEARRTIERVDEQRATRCKLYSGQVWGAAENYDLTIDSSRFDAAAAAQMIIDAARATAPSGTIVPHSMPKE